ncbi:MAG: Uma2 family endonuclease [Alphaproteobacteria bacterium]|jgi:Uma2 family endonuclease
MAKVLPKEKMDVDTFIAWAMEQDTGRYELVGGEIIAMSPERVDHVRAKADIWLALRNAICDADLPCEAFIDGVGVRINEHTYYEPDAFVRCGEPLDGNVVEADDPIIIVEVLSPSTRNIDTGLKLTGYFRLPSLRHYLVINTEDRRTIHYQRDEVGEIHMAILPADARLMLDPPGIHITLADAFQSLPKRPNTDLD